MAATQYIGAHYVPHGWEEWNPNTYYDGLFCVSYNYSWFIAKKNVPVGISPVNTEYWAPYSLTTGAQQDIVNLVNQFLPQEALPNRTDLNRITTPGEYMLDGDYTYVNMPKDLTDAYNCTLTVKRLSTIDPTMVNQELRTSGNNPFIFYRSKHYNSTPDDWTNWYLTAYGDALRDYSYKSNWLTGVDVFDTMKPSTLAKWYYFATDCTNTPTTQNYWAILQRGGIAIAFGRSLAITTSKSDGGWNNWTIYSKSGGAQYDRLTIKGNQIIGENNTSSFDLNFKKFNMISITAGNYGNRQAGITVPRSYIDGTNESNRIILHWNSISSNAEYYIEIYKQSINNDMYTMGIKTSQSVDINTQLMLTTFLYETNLV